MSKIINILSWVSLLAVMILLMSFSHQRREVQTYSGVKIFIEQPKNSRFVTQENVNSMFENLGYGSTEAPISTVDIRQIEHLLSNKPSIESANVYKTISGEVMIEVKERTPIVRLYNSYGESFYLDQYGSLMPLSNQYSARVLIANGHINIPRSTVNTLEDLESRLYSIFRKSNTTAVQNTNLVAKLIKKEEELPGVQQLKGLYDLARFINQDSIWRSQISQLYFQENGDIEMIPRVGNHNIILGSPEDFEGKFEKLMTFYQKGLNKTGWNEYSTINLKFKDQVVCTKR